MAIYKQGVEVLGSLAATCYVVASNAKAEVKAFAQILQTAGYPAWVCDGTDDQVEIQAALDSLSSGGKVLLLEGRFTISASINWPNKGGVHLQGQGEAYTEGNTGTEIYLANNSDVSMIVFNTPSGRNFATISELALNGNKANQAAGHGITIVKNMMDVTFRNLFIRNMKEDGIEATPSTTIFNYWMTDLLIENCEGDFLHFDGSSGAISSLYLSNCIMWTDGQYGITLTKVNDVLASNCYMSAELHGLHLLGCSNVLFSSSTFKGNWAAPDNNYDGIYIDDADGTPTTIVAIVGCRVYGTRHRYAANIQGASDEIVIASCILADGLTGSVNVAAGINLNGRIYNQYSNLFMDVIAASTNHLLNAQDVSGYTGGETPAIAAQPDAPRNITVTAVDAAAEAPVLTMTIIITGVDAKGNSVSETFETSGSETKTGNIAFATVSQIEVDVIAGNGAGDTLSVGIGSKLGLSDSIDATGDVYKCTKNGADYSGAGNITPDATYDTVDVSTGGAIGAADDFTIWYRSNLNIVS